MTLRTKLAGLAAIVAVAGAGAAAGQDAPVFPVSLERESLLLWLQRETDIMPDRVLAVTPQAITSVVSTFPSGGGNGPRVVIRAEALSAETQMRTGALSWHVSMQADCQGRRIRLGETTGYPRRNLLGERMLLRAAEADWRAADRGTALDSAWRAACEPGFKGPFQAGPVQVAKPDAGPPVAPAPAPPSSPAPAPIPSAPATPAPAGAYLVQVGATTSETEAR
ncbi:MAG: hypothetical protein U1C74_14555, partial [Phenylobacterium sp.]|nr:hypothetical protein [Phenylobacterium sp.]